MLRLPLFSKHCYLLLISLLIITMFLVFFKKISCIGEKPIIRICIGEKPIIVSMKSVLP